MALSLPGQTNYWFHEVWTWENGVARRLYAYMREYTFGDALAEQGLNGQKYQNGYTRTFEWDPALRQWVLQFHQGDENIPKGLTGVTVGAPIPAPPSGNSSGSDSGGSNAGYSSGIGWLWVFPISVTAAIVWSVTRSGRRF